MSQFPDDGIHGVRIMNNAEQNHDADDTSSTTCSISRSKWGEETGRHTMEDLTKIGSPNLVFHGSREEDLQNIYSSASMPVLQGPKQQKGQKRQNKWNSNPASLMEGKSMYTMINEDHTWQRVGKVEAPTERPATRREILALHAFYDIAIELSDRMVRKSNNKLSTGGTNSNSEMEQDVLGVKEDVRLLFDHKVVAKLSLDKAVHQSTLAASIFEHKWADVVLGQAIQQISVSCHEHGQLLRHVRKGLAGSFAALYDLHKTAIGDIHEISKLAESYKADLSVMKEEQLIFERQLEERKKGEILQLEEKYKQKSLEYEDQLKDAENSNKRMNETLITLNNIFRNMRDDADMVRSLDFLDTISKLEFQLSSCFKELESLRPLKQELSSANSTISKLKERLEKRDREINNLQEQLQQRDSMVQELVQGESERLSMIEAKKLGHEVLTTPQVMGHQQQQQNSGSNTVVANKVIVLPNQEGVQDSELNKIQGDKPTGPVTAATLTTEPDTPEINELSGTKGPKGTAASKIRSGMDPQSFVSATTMCSRCNSALDSAENIDHIIEKQDSTEHELPCAGYRILLPNLMGYRPQKPKHWVLRVIRSIVRSKQRSDMRAERDGRTKLRFPEFVYSWFSHDTIAMEDISKDAKLQLHATADENRWALYYGVKKFAKELPEARLFYNLLDEKHGEDELSFYLHILMVTESVVHRLSNESLDWGIGCDCQSYSILEQMYSSDNFNEEVCEFAWIQVKHAAEVVKLIMGNSTPAEKQRTLKRLAECAIQQQSSILQTHDAVNKMIDVHVCIHILLKDFHEEQAHRRAALRLMFGSVAAAGADTQSSNRTVDLQQLTSLVESLNSRALPSDAVEIYRVAHELGKGKVDYESFTKAAEKVNFFSRCLRLPPHFGAENLNGMTTNQTAHLAEIVRKHCALLESCIPEFCETFLDDSDSLKLNYLMDDLKIELNKGKLVLDGRRALCAMRRVLEYMLRRRLDYHELYGESVEAERVSTIVDRELSALSSVVTNFESDDIKERLTFMKKKHSATIIQRKWRVKRENNPSMPSAMRHLLSVSFEPNAMATHIEEKDVKTRKEVQDTKSDALVVSTGSTIAEAQNTENQDEIRLRKRVLRVATRSLEWVLIWIDLIFRRKVHDDMLESQRRYFVQTKGKVNRPPIPMFDDLVKTEPPSLYAVIHEVALSIFGVRALAERNIHDLFVNVHRLAKSHSRVRLFARFTGVQSKALRAQHVSMLELDDDSFTGMPKLMFAEEPMMAELPAELCCQEAIDTYTAALTLMYGANGSSGPLFLNSDGDSQGTISRELAELHIKTLFKGYQGPSKHRPCGSQPTTRAMEEALGCLERIERGNKVNVDSFLLAVMQGWLVEVRIRRKELSTLTSNLVDDKRTKNGLEGTLTWAFFNDHILLSLHSSPTPQGAVKLYRALLKAKDPSEDLRLTDLPQSSLFSSYCRWVPSPDFKGLSLPSEHPGLESYVKLLSYVWNPLKLTIGMEVHRLVSISQGDGEQGDMDSNLGELREVQDSYMSTFDVLEKFFASIAKKPPQEAHVTAAFEKVRATLEKLHCARVAAGIHLEPLVDSLDLVRESASKRDTVKDKVAKGKRGTVTRKGKKKK